MTPGLLLSPGPVAILDARRAGMLAGALRALDNVTRARAGVGLLPELLAMAAELEVVAGLPPRPNVSRSFVGASEPLTPAPAAARLPHDDVLDTAATAERLGCGPANVRDLRARGVLPATRCGGRWLFAEDDVTAELQRRALRT